MTAFCWEECLKLYLHGLVAVSVSSGVSYEYLTFPIFLGNTNLLGLRHLEGGGSILGQVENDQDLFLSSPKIWGLDHSPHREIRRICTHSQRWNALKKSGGIPDYGSGHPSSPSKPLSNTQWMSEHGKHLYASHIFCPWQPSSLLARFSSNFLSLDRAPVHKALCTKFRNRFSGFLATLFLFSPPPDSFRSFVNLPDYHKHFSFSMTGKYSKIQHLQVSLSPMEQLLWTSHWITFLSVNFPPTFPAGIPCKIEAVRPEFGHQCECMRVQDGIQRDNCAERDLVQACFSQTRGYQLLPSEM